jgi:hypothetical protein
LRGLKGYPDEHYLVVKRFGRFPHRNSLLRRPPTAAEEEWLLSDECPGWAKSQTSASRVELIYFDGRGMGEGVRWLLEYTGQPYTEQVPATRGDFLRLRDEEEVLPFGQVPALLTVPVGARAQHVVSVAQTQAIIEYLATKFDYLGLLGDGSALSRARVYVCVVSVSV